MIAAEFAYNFTGVLPVFEAPPRSLPDDFYRRSLIPASDEEFSDPGACSSAAENAKEYSGPLVDSAPATAEKASPPVMAPLVRTSDEYLFHIATALQKGVCSGSRWEFKIKPFGGWLTPVLAEI